jgi:hypothetical protein
VRIKNSHAAPYNAGNGRRLRIASEKEKRLNKITNKFDCFVNPLIPPRIASGAP